MRILIKFYLRMGICLNLRIKLLALKEIYCMMFEMERG